MRLGKLSQLIILALTLVMLFSLVAAEAAPGPVRVIVVFNKKSSGQQRLAAVSGAGGRGSRDLSIIAAKSVVLPDARAALALATSPGVVRVERDVLVSIVAPSGRGKGRGSKTPPPQVTPWGISKVNAPQAWSAGTGAGVKVAVIDTGIDTSHADLKANIKGGYNAINPNKSSKDDNGHGTHVAGTIAALNNSIGVVGVAPSASLYSVKVLSANGSGYLSDVIGGIQWSVANGMQVANVSLGSSSDSQAMHDAVIQAKAAGLTVVAAAGNDYGAPVIYPAAYAEVIAVSATDQNNNLAYFSSYGPQVDLGDPGVSVYSTYKGGGYATLSGTSMATPHVTGSAALVIGSGLATTPDQVKSRLEGTATDLGAAGWDIYFGSGLVNDLAATTP